jgi:ankyrin repeat protein
MNIASLKLLVFLITNNLATPGSVVNILRQITVMTDLRALRSFLTRPGYVAAAFAEKLFPHAIKAQNVTVVKYLLERGLNPDDCSIYGDYTSTKLYGGLLNLGEMTPLTFACQVGNIQLLLTLLAAGADVNKSVICRSPINHGHKIRLTPLSLAIHRVGICDTSNRTDAAREIVLCLLEAGADVNPSLNGQPEVGWVLSLSEASLTGELATLKLLLERGANVCMLDWDGQTALANFFRYSHLLGDEIALNIITVLIDAGADLELPELISGIQKYSDDTYIKTTPINAAAYSGNLKLFDFLLNICPKIDRYSLLCAVTSRKISTVQQLLERVGRVPSPRKYFNGMELSRALKNKDFDIAELLLEFNVIPYDEDTMRDSFRSAIEAGHLRIIERFLSVVFENQDTWHFSQIVSVAPAVLTGQYDLANYLINCGGRVDAEALKFVVSTGNVPFIQRLLEFYEQPFELNLHPLLAAVEYGNPDIVKILLESNLVASFDTPDITMCVDTAVKNKNLDIFHMLLNAGARLNYDGTADFRKYSDSNVYLTPLALAVSRSDHVGMKLLLEAGADPKDSVALYEAVDKGDLHIVRILLQANTNLSKNFGRRSCSIALKYAVDRNSLEMVRLLLSHAEFANCDLNNDALPSAIRMKDEKILREIIRAGINPNGLTHFTQFYLDMERGSLIYGRFRSHNSQICGTALMCTVKERNLNAVKLIIESGADVNLPATRQTRRTPLQAACEVGFLEAVMLLIDNYEADINAPPSDVGGATALQLAAIGGHVGIAYALLSKGADINAPAAKVYGRTALEGAAENGRYDMVKLLLNSGVCITGPGERQYLRAQKFAAKRKHKTVRKLLESASRTVHITSSGHD